VLLGSTPSSSLLDGAGKAPVPDADAARGFTLIELLVVLVIVALVSGVLLTAFDRVIDIRVRLAAFLDGVDAPVLVADWYRSSVSGLIGGETGGKDRFAGSAHAMTGLSLAPLNATAGVPTQITWKVVFEPAAGRSYLRYANGDGPAMTIASWPGEYGGFHYCGADLICHDSWPLDKDSPQLPAIIRVDLIKGTEPWPLLAAPQSHHDQPPTPKAEEQQL